MSDFNIAELIPLLSSKRADVRLQSLQIAAHGVDSTNAADLCEESAFSNIIEALDQPELRIHAATLIINIIAEEGAITQTTLILEKVIDFLKSADCPREEINMYLILLTNLTISEDLCEHFITHCAKTDTSQVLIDHFLAYNPQTVEGEEVLVDYSDTDAWQYFSSVLCNLCRLEGGRRLILSVTTGNMAGCLKQVGYSCLLSSCFICCSVVMWSVVSIFPS
jgi:hypothetical protein